MTRTETLDQRRHDGDDGSGLQSSFLDSEIKKGHGCLIKR